MYKELSVNLSKWYLPLFPVITGFYRFLPLARKKLVFAGKNPTLLQGQIGQQASKLLGFIVDVFFANAKKALTNHKWK